MDIAAWLEGLGLGRYAQAFRANDVDAEVLPRLTAGDLAALGVASVGHRRRLLDAIAALSATDAAAPPARASRPSPAAADPGSRGAERRQLTVMFADLVGSTALSARLDPEEMREVLRSYQDAVEVAVAMFGGHVAKLMGDGVLAYFGWPEAHEDDAERAVRAGLGVVDAVPKLATPAGGPLAARVGIASGLVVVGDLVGAGVAREHAVVGETPNLAARLQDAAGSGAVAIADGTRRLLGRVFELRELRGLWLKGFDRPVPCFLVAGEWPAESRFEAHQPDGPPPMVGRDRELALVLERWRRAAAGEGQALLLVGEAGIGKSRLVRAALDAVAGEELVALRYQCSPHHAGTPLWPVVRQLGFAAGLSPGDPEAARLDKLEALLRQGTEEIGEAASLIAALLGIDAGDRHPPLELTSQQRRARTLAALVGQLLGLARRRGPALMVLEDAHWADPTTLELVGQALDRIAGERVLMMLTSRPDGQPALGGHPRVTRLALDRLGPGPTGAIVARLTGGRGLPPGIAEEIAARTDGVPLFVEELTKAVLEAGAAGAEAAVPVSLHASLLARLDRAPEAKEVAQAAACIGREFAYPLLAAVCPMPEPELRAALDRLGTAGLVFRRGEPPDASFSFKHALIRDVAYESLLRARRREMHARIADALAAAVADAPPELVALHAARAGRAREAVALWLEAGRQAYARSAVHEAVAHSHAALRRLAELPAGEGRDALELQARLGLGRALLATRSWADPEAGEHFAAATGLARRVGSPEQRVAGLFGAFQHRLNRQEFALARPLGEEMLRLAEAADDHAARIVGHRSLGALAHFTGQPTAADRHLRRAVGLHDPARHDDLTARYGFEFRSGAMAPLAQSLVSRGRLREGLALADQALAYAEGLPFRHAWCHTACLVAFALHFARADARFAELAERFTRVAAEQGFAYVHARGEVLVGLVQARAGDAAAGLELVRRGMAGVAATGSRLGRSYDHAILAEALLAAGSPDLAREAAAEGVANACGSGEHFFTPALLTSGALAARASGEPDRAERDLERAVAEARGRGMRLFELRAACHLARSWAEGGQRRRALDLLAPVYGWFGEGSEAPDLVEAAGLVGALGGSSRRGPGAGDGA